MSYNSSFDYDKNPTMTSLKRKSVKTMFEAVPIDDQLLPYAVTNLFNQQLDDFTLNTGTETYWQNGNQGKVVLDNQYLEGSYDTSLANNAGTENSISIRIRVYSNNDTWNFKFGDNEIKCINQVITFNDLFSHQLEFFNTEYELVILRVGVPVSLL